MCRSFSDCYRFFCPYRPKLFLANLSDSTVTRIKSNNGKAKTIKIPKHFDNEAS